MQDGTARVCLWEGSEVSANNDDGPRCGRLLPGAVAAVLGVILMVAAIGCGNSPSAVAHAAGITVNSTADDTNAGHCTLREAINSANHGASNDTGSCRAGTGDDTIRFSVRGTITLGSTLPDIVRTLKIAGPTRNPSGIMVDGAGAYRVMIVDSGATLNLANLTIENGAAPADDSNGGGVLNNGTLTVANSTFSGNAAAADRSNGGGISNNGTLTISNSTFAANTVAGLPSASGWGGGIANFGTLTVTDSIFSGNGKISYRCSGAGIANRGGTATITNGTFSGNRCAYTGGGIYNLNGTLTVANSTFSANTAGNPPSTCSSGGGIVSVGTLTVATSTFSGNSAQIYGGGIWVARGAATITNSTFFGNVVTGCSFVPNQGWGGGIVAFGPLVVTTSTFAANSAAIAGGGVYGTGNVKSTILANNTILGGGPNNCSATITDVGYNISDDNSCAFTAGTSRNNTDPQLDPAGLSDNGGPTQTIALQPNSPAIDVIPLEECTDQASPPKRITTDQRGAPRPDAGEVSCDIGAYEFQDFQHLGRARCQRKSVSALVKQYGSLGKAASAYGFPSVKALRAAIRTSCEGWG